MNVEIRLSPTTPAELREMLAILDARKPAFPFPAASIREDDQEPPDASPGKERGPFETALNERGRRVRFTQDIEQRFGTRETYAEFLLDAILEKERGPVPVELPDVEGLH